MVVGTRLVGAQVPTDGLEGVLARRANELAVLVHRENGKPVDDALLEVALTIEHLDWAAKNAEKVLSEQRVRPSLLSSNHAARLSYEPLGVVAVIGPWNYPVFTPMGSIAYALAAGNAVVFKPSEFTTAVGEWLVATFAEAVPEQPVLSLVTGFAGSGAALCAAAIDKISFTGSTATGKKVMAAASANLTPLVLELGGKDAFPGRRGREHRQGGRGGVVRRHGQRRSDVCGVERVYVHERVFDEFLDTIAEQARALEPGSHPESAYGPMTMPAQIEVVRRHVDDAIAAGGRAVVGGRSRSATRSSARSYWRRCPRTARQ